MIMKSSMGAGLEIRKGSKTIAARAGEKTKNLQDMITTVMQYTVYDDWEECQKQVYRFSGNSYKGYTTRAEAESRYARYLAGERRERRRNRMKTSFIAIMLIVMTAALFYVMVV